MFSPAHCLGIYLRFYPIAEVEPGATPISPKQTYGGFCSAACTAPRSLEHRTSALSFLISMRRTFFLFFCVFFAVFLYPNCLIDILKLDDHVLLSMAFLFLYSAALFS